MITCQFLKIKTFEDNLNSKKRFKIKNAIYEKKIYNIVFNCGWELIAVYAYLYGYLYGMILLKKKILH